MFIQSEQSIGFHCSFPQDNAEAIVSEKLTPSTKAQLRDVTDALRTGSLWETTEVGPPSDRQQALAAELANSVVQNCIMVTDPRVPLQPDVLADMTDTTGCLVETIGALVPGGMQQLDAASVLSSGGNISFADLTRETPTPVYTAAVNACVALLGSAAQPFAAAALQQLYPVLARLPTLLSVGRAVPKVDSMLSRALALPGEYSAAERAAAGKLHRDLRARGLAFLANTHIGLPAAAASLCTAALEEQGKCAATVQPPAALAAIKAWHRLDMLGDDSSVLSSLPTTIVQDAGNAAFAAVRLMLPRLAPRSGCSWPAVLAAFLETGGHEALARGLPAVHRCMEAPTEFFFANNFLAMGQVLVLACQLGAIHVPFVHASLLSAATGVLDAALRMHDEVPGSMAAQPCNIRPATPCRCFGQGDLPVPKLCQGLLIQAAVILSAVAEPYRQPGTSAEQLPLAQRTLMLGAARTAARAATWALQKLCQPQAEPADCDRCLATLLYRLAAALHSVLDACAVHCTLATAFSTQLWADVRVFHRRLSASRPVRRLVAKHSPPHVPSFADFAAGLGRLMLMQEQASQQVPLQAHQVSVLMCQFCSKVKCRQA